VLYEMLVGKKAFDGESVSDTLALSFCFDVQLKTLRTKRCLPPSVMNRFLLRF